MWRFERLEKLGVEPEFFYLPRSVDGLDAVAYYLLAQEPGGDVRHGDRWIIVAVGTPTASPFELVLRAVHIDGEALEWMSIAEGAGTGRVEEDHGSVGEAKEWSPFDGGLLLFTRAELPALRDFLLALADQLPARKLQGGPHTYFLPASADDYAACGIPRGLIERFSFHFRDVDVYRYQRDATITPRDDCCFLRISHWTIPSHPASSTLDVALETYTPERIAAIQRDWAMHERNQAVQPLVEADMMDGEWTLRFSRGALLALASLIEERL
jgi:hypothetical protein